jgi:hypothetical protein
VIERSPDAVNWSDLGEIAASNDANGAAYTYKDPSPLPAAYYRLKIIGQSGSISYSPVFRGGCSDIALPFIVYPNSSQGAAIAQISVREATTASLQMVDMSGQVIYVTDWILQPGINQYLLPLSGLASSTYIVKLSLNGKVLQTKLIKL